MTTSQDNDNQFFAELPGPLLIRLMSRHIHPMGIIDVYHAQKHYAGIAGWLENRFPLLDRLLKRRNTNDGFAAETGQLAYQVPIRQIGDLNASQSFPLSSLETTPSQPEFKKKSDITLPDPAQKVRLGGASNAEERSRDAEVKRTGNSHESPPAVTWRIRRAPSPLPAKIPVIPADNVTYGEPEPFTRVNGTMTVQESPQTETNTMIAPTGQGNAVPRQQERNEPFTRRSTVPAAVDNPAVILHQHPVNTPAPSGIDGLITIKNLAAPKVIQKIMIETKTKNSRFASFPAMQKFTSQQTSTDLTPINPHPKATVTAFTQRTQALGMLELIQTELLLPSVSKTKPIPPVETINSANQMVSPNGVPHRRTEELPKFKATPDSVTSGHSAINGDLPTIPGSFTPRFSKKEWAKLIESVSKIIWEKLLSDLERKGIRVWR